jgi:hypothetical protein
MKDSASISFVYLEIKPVHRYAKQSAAGKAAAQTISTAK